MNSTVQPVNHFQVAQDPISMVMNFDLDWLDQQSSFKSACKNSPVTTDFLRQAKQAVAPIDLTSVTVGQGAQIDILWKLDRKTLERMATNPCTPVAVLVRLADHPMAEVRAAVSDNANTPEYVVWGLSQDGNSDVRYQIAENHSLPAHLIGSLTNDENPYVACRAQQTYNRLLAA